MVKLFMEVCYIIFLCNAQFSISFGKYFLLNGIKKGFSGEGGGGTTDCKKSCKVTSKLCRNPLCTFRNDYFSLNCAVLNLRKKNNNKDKSSVKLCCTRFMSFFGSKYFLWQHIQTLKRYNGK